MLSKSVKCAVIVLCELDKEKRSKHGLMVSDLRGRISSGEIYKVLPLLKDAGMVGHKTHLGDYMLTTDIREISLYDVMRAIDGWPDVFNTQNPWPETKRAYASAKEIGCCMDEIIKDFAKKTTIYDFSVERGFNTPYWNIENVTI